MKEVTAFEASDGKIFATANSCVMWEEHLRWKEKIGEFMASEDNCYKGSPQQTMVTNSIIAWEVFKAKQVGKI